MTDIKKLSKLYVKQSVGLTAIMFFIALIVMNVWHLDYILTPLVISVCFSLAVDMADSIIWCRVAAKSPENLPTFYTAVSGFRMLFALLTMFVYYLVAGRDAMLVFFLVFMAFYVMLLIHHTVFFAKLSAKS